MIVPSVLLTTYAALLPALEHVYRSAHEVLSNFAVHKSFPQYGRIKSVELTAEKIETGRYSSLLDLDDLVAFTIIIPTRADESVVTDFLASQFDVIRSTRGGTRFICHRTYFHLTSHDYSAVWMSVESSTWILALSR